MKAKQPDRVFDFDQVAGTSAFLAESFTQENVDLAAQVGRYPGTWTLPVCDASTWGARWNWDYTKNKNPQEGDSTETHPPCLCGECPLYPASSLPQELSCAVGDSAAM